MLPGRLEYFYIVKNIHSGLLYAGSKYSKRSYSHPDQLFNANHPYPYFTSCKTINNDIQSYEIVKVKSFITGGAHEYETRFLKRIKARKNKLWINSHENDGLIKNNWQGKTHSLETKLKISLGNKNKFVSDETRTKISESKKKYVPLICPHCNKSGNSGNMQRWHFDNCLSIGAIRKSISDETKAKISNFQKGRPKSDKTRLKMSIAAKNRPAVSSETKIKLSRPRKRS